MRKIRIGEDRQKEVKPTWPLLFPLPECKALIFIPDKFPDTPCVPYIFACIGVVHG